MYSVQLGRTRHIRKKLHFTDECHQMMVLIRKRAHFTDDATLPFPFRDTGFSAEKGVSLQGGRRNSAEYARDTGFLTEKGVSREEKAAQCPEICSRYRVFSSKGCVAARGTSQFRKFCSRYRVFDRKRCVAVRESCPMYGNLFAIQGFQLKRVCRCKGSPLFF